MKNFLHLFLLATILFYVDALPLTNPSRTSAAKILDIAEEKIEPELRLRLQENPAAELPIIVYLTQQADLTNVVQAKGAFQTSSERRRAVVKLLVQTAYQSQKSVLNTFPSMLRKSLNNQVESFWIFNGFATVADMGTIKELAASPQVAAIYLNRVIRITAPENPFTPTATLDVPASPTNESSPTVVLSPTLLPSQTSSITPTSTLTPTPSSEVEWGLRMIQADRVWKELQVTGEGVVVGTIDSGVQWTHPALKSKYRGWDGEKAEHRYSWYDAINQKDEPYDDQGHGTHTMGSLVGSTEDGEQIGAAPGAKWITVKALDEHGSGLASTLLKAMEWMMAPGGNPDMAPQIVSNSWGARTCEDTFRSAVQAWEAAGIIGVFSGGNSGAMGDSTIGSPACYPEVLGVGATNNADQVADFSSRGPSPYGGVKPDVCAPGVDIRSSLNNGDYGTKSGTSMATPYVSGVIALMLSADPSMTLSKIKEVLEKTAVDVGDSGQDNKGGWGRIDAYAAVKMILSKNQTPTPTASIESTVTVMPTPTIENKITETPSMPTTQLPAGTSTSMPLTVTPNPTITATGTLVIKATPTSSESPNVIMTSVSNKPSVTPMASITPPRELKADGTILDDSNPQLNYSSGWKVAENASFYQGGVHFSEVIGSNISLAFEGEGISIISTYAPTYGTLYVMIDGNSVEKIDLYAPQVLVQQEWRSKPLKSGKHWLKVLHYSGGSVNIDAIVVHPHRPESTDRSTKTPTDE